MDIIFEVCTWCLFLLPIVIQGSTVKDKKVHCGGVILRAVNNHWTGLLDWTTGLDYWTDQFYHKIDTCGLKTLHRVIPK